MSEDLALLKAWQEGDNAAGNTLVSRHFDSLYRFFRNKAGDEIDDLLQRTLLACVEAQPRFSGRSSFRTFLFGIARNVLLTHFRHQRARKSIDFGEHSVEDLGTSPTEVIARSQQARLLLRALRRIPVDHQIALELYYWEAMDTVEIGEVLGIPASTARTRLRRARISAERELAELAADGEALRSTIDHLERWARQLRDDIGTRS